MSAQEHERSGWLIFAAILMFAVGFVRIVSAIRYVGRLSGTQGAIWQLTAIDIASSFAWAQLVICQNATPGNAGNPSAEQTSALARRVAHDLAAAGWRLDRLLSDDGNEFKGQSTKTISRLNVKHTRIHAGRKPTATSRRCTKRSSTSAGAPAR